MSQRSLVRRRTPLARRTRRGAPTAIATLLTFAAGANGAAPLELTARITEQVPTAGAGLTGAGAGDVNGDGRDDLLVWRPGAGAGTPPTAGTGALWVVYGSAEPSNLTVPPAPSHGFQIKASGAIPVTGAKRLGDFDGDGYDDLIVFADKIFVVYGAAASGTVTLGGDDRTTIVANGIPSVVPSQAVAVGDFNGDGKDDVLANRARPPRLFWSQQTGAAVLFGGARVPSYDIRLPSSRVATINGGVSCTWYGVCGESIVLPAPLGDINGDGFDDLANQLNGVPYIALGRPGAPVLYAGRPDAESIRLTLRPGTFLSGQRIGDVTGDGIDDIPVERGLSGTGPGLTIVPGRRIGPTTIDVAATPTIAMNDPAVDARLATLSPAGDLDGDGRDELIGALYSPAAGGPELIVPAIPAAPGTARNASAPAIPSPPTSRFDVVPAGDLDGDGLGDVIYSAPLHDVGGLADAGAVFVATHRGGALPEPEPVPTPTPTPAPTPTPQPEPADSAFAGWTPSGTATVVPGGGGVELTNPTATMQSGAIYDTRRKVDANKLTVEFDATMDGGTGQGNGLTLALASAAQGGTATARNADVGLGWIPNKGAAIVFGTVASIHTPGNSYAGITVAAKRYGFPALIQNNSVTPLLAGRTSHIKVELKAGRVDIAVDGRHVTWQDNVALPTDAWLGFTASTGARTQRHLVRNVSITLG